MARKERVFMSNQDLAKFSFIEDFIEKRLTRKQTAEALGADERTIARIARKVEAHGLPEVFHRNRGRVPQNKSDELTKRCICRRLSQSVSECQSAAVSSTV